MNPPPLALHKVRIPEKRNHLKIGEDFRIFISEISNPLDFYFLYYESCSELDNLTSSMEKFYKNLGKQELQIMESNFAPGMPFATEIYGFWHRGEILGPPKNGLVCVEFIDYGSKSQIPVQQIKYLLEEFSLIPRQTLKGGLVGVKPDKTSVWDLAATKEMLDYASEKFLFAKYVKEGENVRTSCSKTVGNY